MESIKRASDIAKEIEELKSKYDKEISKKLESFSLERSKGIKEGLKRVRAGIKAFRKRKGFTMKELSSLSEVKETILNAIENGGQNPTLEQLLKISLALQAETTELLEYQEIES